MPKNRCQFTRHFYTFPVTCTNSCPPANPPTLDPSQPSNPGTHPLTTRPTNRRATLPNNGARAQDARTQHANRNHRNLALFHPPSTHLPPPGQRIQCPCPMTPIPTFQTHTYHGLKPTPNHLLISPIFIRGYKSEGGGLTDVLARTHRHTQAQAPSAPTAHTPTHARGHRGSAWGRTCPPCPGGRPARGPSAITPTHSLLVIQHQTPQQSRRLPFWVSDPTIVLHLIWTLAACSELSYSPPFSTPPHTFQHALIGSC